MNTERSSSTVANEELIRQTHAMIKTMYRAYWWSRIFGWIKFVVFILIPLSIYWWIAPQIPVFQDRIFQTLEQYRQTMSSGAAGSNQQLTQWCRMYCANK